MTPMRTATLVLLALLLPVLGHAAPPTPSITVSFDHLATGFELDGLHRDLPCESCHLNAVFRGTPRTCGVCHIQGSKFNATSKTQTHIPSTNNCAACHNTASFGPAVHFDHAEVMGACVTCHNGTLAQGVGPSHPATSKVCEACHTVLSWNPPKAVDHNQIPLSVSGFCIICHNGTQASGKPSNHVPTNLECGDCHVTATWLGASFDHTGITTGCVTCHNGVKAVGKQGAHMPTSNVCEACHTAGIGTKTPSWVPAPFDHTQMAVNTCQTCHSGTVKISTGFVPGQPANHVPPIPSSIDCGVCHGNNPAAETWTVLAASIATLHTGLNTGNCVLCHGGETFAGVPAPYSPMSIRGVSPTKATPLSPAHIPVLVGTDCSACHGAAYQAGGFGPATQMNAAKHAFVSTACDTCHEAGRSFYTGSGTPLQLRPADHMNGADPRMATSDCSLCHETTDWNSTMLPTGHMPNPGNQGCSVCHTAIGSTTASYAALASIAVLHTGISGGCAQCHGGPGGQLTFYNNNDNPKAAVLTPSHIPYLAGTDCSACHAANYVAGGFGPTAMSAAKHAYVPNTCDTCHEAGLSFYMGASTPALQGRPADHLSSSNPQMVSGDCSACHTTANWNSTAMPAGHMPNPAGQACATCHTSAPSDYSPATLAANSVLHTGIASGCGQCHGGTTPLTWYNNFTPKDAVLTPAHIPYLSSADCGSCHSSATYAAGTFGPMNMTQAKHAFVPTTCNTCHEAGLSFYMGAASPGLQGRPADHNSGQMAAPNDCSQCHTTANWNSTAMPAGHMPNPASQACTVCHTTAPADYSPTTLASNTVLHTGIASGCITCHGAPNGAPLVFYNNFSPKSAVLSPVHIPTASTPCEDCHSPSVFTSFGGTTMSATKHTMMFTVIGNTCDACHNRVTPPLTFYGVTNLTVRPTDHNSGSMATNDCSGCHNPNDWGGNNAAGRTTVKPASMHPTTRGFISGVVVPNGLPPAALVAQLAADLGPGTARPVGSAASPATSPAALPAALPARTASAAAPSHAGVTANCASCHNGVLAQAKPATHVASNAACENCHTTLGWTPARFDHRGVSASCVSCHNGVRAPGMPARHVATVRDCGTCHGVLSWSAARFNHLGVNALCQSCHNGVAATGKQPRHVITTRDCGTCHTTLGWNVVAPVSPPAQVPAPAPSAPPPAKPAASGPAK